MIIHSGRVGICATCKAWKPTDGMYIEEGGVKQAKEGLCRRRSPSVVSGVDDEVRRSTYFGVWPTTSGISECYDWIPNESFAAEKE